MAYNKHDDDSPTVDIAVELVHETDLAFLFHDGDHQVWVPKSICTWDPREHTITVPEWFAMREGLI